MNFGMFNVAGTLLSLAHAAYGRTKGAPAERAEDQMDALIAVVFSAAALEAFINEAMELATLPMMKDSPQEPESIKTFASLLKEVEGSRGSINLKYMLARVAFTGHAYDVGAKPYQDFALLIDLRNALVHLKPLDRFPGMPELFTPAPILERLRSYNILAEYEGTAAMVIAPWILTISTRGVARWACTVAVEMYQSVMSVIPESEFKRRLDLSYSLAFQLVE